VGGASPQGGCEPAPLHPEPRAPRQRVTLPLTTQPKSFQGLGFNPRASRISSRAPFLEGAGSVYKGEPVPKTLRELCSGLNKSLRGSRDAQPLGLLVLAISSSSGGVQGGARPYDLPGAMM
jgi:hypothetical protein